jgi:molybdopterin converting factor small subunit
MAKKLLNFFINEEKHGSHKMKEWQFGGRSDINKTMAMVFVDMWPTTLKKCDNEREMEKQYKKVAKAFGLDSYYDLMSISYVMMQMHVLLFAKVKEERGGDGKLQIHIASAATNKYVFGNGPGVKKYLERYVSPNYEQSSGPHPQLWLMGGTKNENVWPDDVRRVITSNLRRVYGNVHRFKVDFESEIMTIFGSTSSSIAVGLYSRTARVFEDASLLDLDMRSESPKLPQEQSEYVMSILSKCGVSEAIINFMTIELKTSDLSLVMRRLRSFNASRRMHFIASNLPDTTSEFSKLTSDLQAMIEGLSSTLDKTTDVVLRKLQRMKIAQDNNGRMQAVASLLRDTTSSYSELSPDVQSRVRELSSTLDKTTDVVLGKLQRMKIAQDNNGRMQTVASSLRDTTSSYSELSPEVQSMVRELSNTLNEEPGAVLQKLQGIKIAQVNNGKKLSSLNHSLHHLAKVFNDAPGDIGERQNEVRDDPKFMSFMKASGRDHTSETDCKAAIEEVMKTARAYDKTFWTNFAELVAYIRAHPDDFETIGDDVILVIDISRNREKYKPLKRWVEVMNGYTKHKNYEENAYGLKAYEMMGSIEQLALVDKGVCFNPELYGEANTNAQEGKFSGNQADLLSNMLDFI